MILVHLARWSYERLQDDNNIFYKIKNDLTTGTWQDDIWWPTNIILLCTSDASPTSTYKSPEFSRLWPQRLQSRSRKWIRHAIRSPGSFWGWGQQKISVAPHDAPASTSNKGVGREAATCNEGAGECSTQLWSTLAYGAVASTTYMVCMSTSYYIQQCWGE